MNYLIEFQKEHDLVPDGELGKVTARALKDTLQIPSMISLCYLLGQIRLESANFTAGRENLFYSRGETLLKVFPSYFKNLHETVPYIKNPSKLANYVYANRMGNGSSETNDGWNNRGVGGIQLTGKSNIEAYLKTVHLSPSIDRKLLESPDHFFNIGAFYFTLASLWRFTLCESEDNIRKVSRGVQRGNPFSNKPALHEDLRIRYTEEYFKKLL